MICIYHSKDLDGHCSGAIVKLAHPDCRMIGLDYDDQLDWAEVEGQTVFMVDVSLQPYERMVELKRRAKRVIWCDHHATAIKGVADLGLSFEGRQEIGKAGAQLTWEFLHPGKPVPRVVQLVSMHDLWDHEDPDVWPTHYGLGMFGTDPQCRQDFGNFSPPKNLRFGTVLWSDLIFNRDDILGYVQEKGREIEASVKKFNADYAAEMAFEITLPNGWRAIAVNKGFSGSSVLDSVYDPAKHDVKLVFSWVKDHWHFSLYCEKDSGFNCGEFASEYGGGGHVGAAGWNGKRPDWLGL